MKKMFKKTSITILMGTVLSSAGFIMPVGLSTFANTAHAENNAETVNLPIIFNKDISKTTITNLSRTKKLVIDFFDVQDGLAKEPLIDENNPLISKVNTKKFGDRVRIIIDTKSPVKYKLENKGKTSNLVLIAAKEFEEINTSIPSVSAIPNTVSVVKSSLEPVVNKSTELEHVNIKKSDGSIKLVLDLNNPNFTPVFTKEDNYLLVDLKGVAIPLDFQKVIDTKGLGGLLKSVDIGSQKGNGRLRLKSVDNWDYSSYQLDKKFVIEIKAGTDKEDKTIFKGKPLSLNFQNMDVRAILQVIADFTNLNIMASDSVQGNMSIRLKDVPWDQALNLVLESKNLNQIKEGNVVWIATAQEISDKNKAKLELKTQVNELAPLKVKFFQLNHYNAKEMKDVLEGKVAGGTAAPTGKGSPDKMLLSSRGTIGLDIRNNTIFIQDTEDKLSAVESVIKRLDTPVRQVLIEAKMIVVTDGFQKQLGSQFGFAKNGSIGNNIYGIGSTQSQSQSQVAGSGASIMPMSNSWSSPATGGGTLGFTILNAISGNALSLEISALESKNLGKVISSPKLLTADNKKAEIKQGTQVPYVIPGTANNPPTVNFKDALLKLGVTPQVSPNGRIVMDLDISKDTIGQWVSLPGGGSVPSIDTRSINTQVTVNDGQTVILGGIYEVSSSEDISKVPLLGDIPFVGNLFKNTDKQTKKVELIIFITPHVINDSDLDVLDMNGKDTEEIDFKK